MNKTQIKRFASKVETIIKRNIIPLIGKPLQDKLEFYEKLIKDGGEYLPEVDKLTSPKVNLEEHFKSIFGNYIGLGMCKGDPFEKEPSELTSFELSDRIIQTLHWATDFQFCRRWSERYGCCTVELIEDFINVIRKEQTTSNYLIEKYFYTYFVNRVIVEHPDLINP